MDGQIPRGFCQIGHVGPDFGGEIEFSLIYENQNCCDDKLFGQRADLELGLCGGFFLGGEICRPITAFKDNATLCGDQDIAGKLMSLL